MRKFFLAIVSSFLLLTTVQACFADEYPIILPNGNILVGDASNLAVPTPAAPSATIDTTNADNITSGTLSSTRLPASGVTAGSYALTNLTVDTVGRITSVSNGVVTPANDIVHVSGTLTSYQIQHLHGTPIPLVVAQGLHTVVVPVSMSCKLNYGGIQFTGPGGISLAYGTTPAGPSIFNNTSMTGATNQWNVPAMTTTTLSSGVENAALNFYNSWGAEFVNGNSSIQYDADFRVVTY